MVQEKRIHSLACPKPVPVGFIDDSRSVYWNNNLSKDWQKDDKSTTFSLTKRLDELTRPKPMRREWTGDRPSPIWLVSKNALKAKPRHRLEALSISKKYHSEFQPHKSVYTTVNNAAKRALPSIRIDTLSKPKQYIELPIKPESCWDYSEWKSDVSDAVLEYQASTRMVNLAKAKTLHKDYKECRPVMWGVSSSAKKTSPSIRVQNLSRPKSRSQYKEDYDSNWYKVSKGAITAQPTPRLEDLSLPIPWKVRQKR